MFGKLIFWLSEQIKTVIADNHTGYKNVDIFMNIFLADDGNQAINIYFQRCINVMQTYYDTRI